MSSNQRVGASYSKFCWFINGLVLIAAAASFSACLRQRATINRVQPDYLDKRVLVPNQYGALTNGSTPEMITPELLAREPVFYTQTTVIAKPTTTGFVGLTDYSQSDKIRWEVTQDYLVAHQSYSFVQGAPLGAAGVGQNLQTGDVVAVFKISKHFDIRRAYNTTTGEELNVIDENTTDRPWYQQQYIRVDWSANLVSGYNSPLYYAEWSGRIQSEPVPVFVNTPNDPNAPVFEYAGTAEEPQLTYFDIVNKAVLHPETINLGDGYTNVPVCLLGEGETDCGPSELTFRVSFKRVDPDRDYEPASLSEPLPNETGTVADTPHLNMERFGFFDVGRIGYDPQQHAILDTKRIHYAARHNLWLHHHALAYGDNTKTLCNADSECGDPNLVCKIGNAPIDSSHRGTCAALAIAHSDGEVACQSDSDCKQWGDTGGVSKTAVCDLGNHTCGEHYYRCATDDDCSKIDPQSTCDLAIANTRADNRGLCLMPFRQRQVRQIAYHESIGYPDYMQPVTEQIVKEWNDAFVTAVSAARRHECELEKEIDASATELASNPCNDAKITGLDAALGADGQFIFIGCHSPVWGTADGDGKHSQEEVDAAHAKGWDLSACGPQGTKARLGDLRYNLIGAITDQDAQGQWGLANLASDPETGEMVAGRGAVWQTVTDYYASYLVQLVRVLTGDLSPGSLSEGGDLVSAMKQIGTGDTPSKQILDAPFRSPNGLKDIANMKTGLAKLKLADAGWLTPSAGHPLVSKDIDNPGALDIAQQRLLAGRILGDGSNRGAQRLGDLRGTDLEGMMMNTQQARLAPSGTPDDTAALPSTLNAASPMRQQSSATRHLISRLKSQLSAYQCGMEASFSDDMLLGLAQRLATGRPIQAADPDDGPVAFGRDWNFQKSDGTLDYDLMQIYAGQFIHHGVLAHELGHSLGQRHNFTASADAINYHDNYWKVRGKGHPQGLRPRYDYLSDPADGNYYSQEEIDGRVDEFAYSSVMDYKGLNEDAHGIGRYDYAFIKNGYVGLVEAFKSVADKSGALSYSMNVAGAGFSTPLDLRQWVRGGKIKGMHYTQIPQLFGTRGDGTPNIGADNRYDVFLRETAFQPVDGFGTPSFSNVTIDSHILVPYRFDTDERAGLVWQDQRYDAGGDPFESLHYVASHLVDYYFVNSFARLRTGFSTQKYVDRMSGRFIDQLQQTTRLLAFDLVSYQDFFATDPSWPDFLTAHDSLGGFVNHAAMSLSVDAFVALLTMPEMGGHEVQPQLDGSSLLVPSLLGPPAVSIAINDGRAFESNWRNDAGFWWYEELNRAGAYYDKTLSVFALTDPELMVLQRDAPSDIRLFQLSYYTLFPDQMTRLFGALLSEDTADFAPIYSAQTSSIIRTHVPTINLPPGDGAGQSGRVIDAGHTPLDPQTHFTMQLWSAIATISQFPATYDQTYMDFARLWVDGSVEAISVSDPATETASFTDPWTHLTYRALHIGTSAGEAGAGVGASPIQHQNTVPPEAGVAARMILHIQDLDALRLKAQTEGRTTDESNIELQERKYLDIINVMRQLTKYFG